LNDYYAAVVKLVRHEQETGLDLLASPKGNFWKRRQEEGRGLSYLLAEHQWMVEHNPRNTVRHGEIVLDCGAHIGVFTSKALELGAAKVVAVEPDPSNLESLRRNFSREIAAGRVVLAPVAVWSSEGKLSLHLGTHGNTGVNSVVADQGGTSVEVPATTIDRLVDRLRLPRVDFIKMDIEGAEREALRGAAATLKKYRPRLMLDMYHRPDDPVVLPAIIRQAWPDYKMDCGPCEAQMGEQTRLVPHVSFFH
jgi:FkbM family methyltransferase